MKNAEHKKILITNTSWHVNHGYSRNKVHALNIAGHRCDETLHHHHWQSKLLTDKYLCFFL